jgi:ABC-type cobalt transport system substrate-binding protein
MLTAFLSVVFCLQDQSGDALTTVKRIMGLRMLGLCTLLISSFLFFTGIDDVHSEVTVKIYPNYRPLIQLAHQPA